MNLYIQIRNGQPYEHPIFEDNFLVAFPEIDTNNLPPEFARFIRIPTPKLGPYEKNQTHTYGMVDGVWMDVYSCETITAEEILAKQNLVKAQWESFGFPSWVFNETTCSFDPPTPRPDDLEKLYVWDETSLTWVEAPT